MTRKPADSNPVSQRFRTALQGAVEKLKRDNNHHSATRGSNAASAPSTDVAPTKRSDGMLLVADEAANVTPSPYLIQAGHHELAGSLKEFARANPDRMAQDTESGFAEEDLEGTLREITTNLPEVLVQALSRYVANPQAPGSPLMLSGIPAALAAEVALLAVWTPASYLGGPSPTQLREVPGLVGAELVVDFDVYWCDECTQTDTSTDDTHWLIEVARIYSPGYEKGLLTPQQETALASAAATCGALADGSTVTYVGGSGRDCPQGCTAHEDHRHACRPRPGREDVGPANNISETLLYDRVEDAVRAEVHLRLTPGERQRDQLEGRTLEGFPAELLATLRPLLDPAGMNRPPRERPWFTVTLSMKTAARIIVNHHWAPELDYADHDPAVDDLSGYYIVPSPMMARWLLSTTSTRDQHWNVQLRFTDLTGQDRPSGVSPAAESMVNAARTTGEWTVGIDWLAVDVTSDPYGSPKALRHRARADMLAAIGWASLSYDHPDAAGVNFWHDCGAIDFTNLLYTTGPKPGDVCDCGVQATFTGDLGTAAGTGIYPA